MKEKMKVSIITVVYNGANTIAQTIESVISQDYDNLEYIIIDGDSTDGTQEIIKRYEDRISYWVSEPDAGIYDAMNKGLSHATGELVGIINGDDWYEPGAVKKVAEIYEKTPYDMLYGEIRRIDENGETEGVSASSYIPPHPSMFVAGSVYQRYGMFDTRYKIAGDHEFKLRLYAKRLSIIHIGDVLANFRLTGVSSVKLLETAKETYEINQKYIGQCLPEILNREQVEAQYKRILLREIMTSKPDETCDRLRRYGIDFEQGVILFGAGKWGVRFYALFQNRVAPLLVTDNDKEKWGEDFFGTQISPTRICRDFKGCIVVTAVKAQAEIMEQLQKEFHPAAEILTIDDICNIVCKDSA